MSAVRYRSLSRDDEPSRAIPARRGASRSSVVCIGKRRASQIRPAASGRPYRALRRHRLYHRLDCAGRALSRPPAAGDALDADPSCRGLRAPTRGLPVAATWPRHAGGVLAKRPHEFEFGPDVDKGTHECPTSGSGSAARRRKHEVECGNGPGPRSELTSGITIVITRYLGWDFALLLDLIGNPVLEKTLDRRQDSQALRQG
jgi:hypothetical protein